MPATLSLAVAFLLASKTLAMESMAMKAEPIVDMDRPAMGVEQEVNRYTVVAVLEAGSKYRAELTNKYQPCQFLYDRLGNKRFQQHPRNTTETNRLETILSGNMCFST